MDVFLKYISRGGPNGVDDDSGGGGGGGGGGNKVCFIFTTPLAKYRPVFPRDIDISGVPGLLLLTPFLHWHGIYVFFLRRPSLRQSTPPTTLLSPLLRRDLHLPRLSRLPLASLLSLPSRALVSSLALLALLRLHLVRSSVGEEDNQSRPRISTRLLRINRKPLLDVDSVSGVFLSPRSGGSHSIDPRSRYAIVGVAICSQRFAIGY